ncbi:MAG TPA: HAD-IC family P-type ATPase, partial [Chlamydiales bacterium]|nr:HAD-IC family P-type ATPase [Chlamydiales bacterium]
IIFDKTGTLTEGKPTIQDIMAKDDYDKNELLRLAAAVQQLSEHPLAKAIVEANQLAVPAAEQFKSYPGKGTEAIVDGKTILLGKASFLKEKRVQLTPVDQTAVYMSINGIHAGTFLFHDALKSTTRAAVDALHRKGIETIMLTGDSAGAADQVAKALEIKEVRANVSPEEKQLYVQRLQEVKKKVAFCGDGINDAAALQTADVGIAMGTGTDVALESAPVALIKGDLAGVAKAIELSHQVMVNIKENLFFALFYNALAIPVAAGLLFPFTGILLHPMIAAAAMCLSSLSVVLNALRLRHSKHK